MNEKKHWYKIKLYPFTYNKIRIMMKCLNCSFDDAVQTLQVCSFFDNPRFEEICRQDMKIEQFRRLATNKEGGRYRMTNYKFKTFCVNCEDDVYIEIPRKQTVKDYLINNKIICKHCGCNVR